jgi:PEGA domain-containing protein
MARLFVAIAFVIGCGGKPLPPKPPPTPPPPVAVRGTLALDIDPGDAEVEVDGSSRGKASELKALDLEPGPHQIVITKKGYEIWRGEVALAKTSETIQVRLVPSK